MKRLRTCIALARRKDRRPVATTSHAWRPLALSWRRQAARSPAATPTRTSPALHRHFHTQLQLTWNSWLAASPPRSLASRAPICADSGRTLTFSRLELLRETRQRVESRQELLRLRTLSDVRRECLTRSSHTTSFISVSAPRATMISAPPVHASHPGVTPAIAAPSDLVRRATLPAWRATPLVRRVPRGAMSEERERERPLATDRKSVPLVWLKPTAATTAATPLEKAFQAPSMIDAPTSAPAARVVASAPAQQAQAAREAVRTSLMDASVVDRLAEDVMKRVDKRLRIERERRGL